MAVASGGFTDTWRGRFKTKAVALKAFRTYPSQDLKEAKKVFHSRHSRLLYRLTSLADSLEGGRRLAAVVS